MVYEFRVNGAARVHLQHMGHEMQPVLIIDDPVMDPDGLVTWAAETPFGAPTSAYYPGLNAPMPDGYLNGLLPVLRPSIERAFGISSTRPVIAMGFFALATHDLAQLGPLQRLPHYDQLDKDCLAVVHYLCQGQGGGTGFFRHQATGFEYVDASRRDLYRAQIDGWLSCQADSLTQWAGPHTPGFEMTGKVDMRFNRLVIYRSHVLHCALFEGTHLSSDPRRGRLTANSFIGAR